MQLGVVAGEPGLGTIGPDEAATDDGRALLLLVVGEPMPFPAFRPKVITVPAGSLVPLWWLLVCCDDGSGDAAL